MIGFVGLAALIFLGIPGLALGIASLLGHAETWHDTHIRRRAPHPRHDPHVAYLDGRRIVTRSTLSSALNPATGTFPQSPERAQPGPAQARAGQRRHR